jgi:hypothetical protein
MKTESWASWIAYFIGVFGINVILNRIFAKLCKILWRYLDQIFYFGLPVILALCEALDS